MFNSISLKIGNMRKPQNFTIYPYNENSDTITIQSDKSIGSLHKETGEFIFTSKGSYFPHLQMFGQVTEIPQDVKDEIKRQYEDGKRYSAGDGMVKIFG